MRRNLFGIMLAYKGKWKIQSFFYILAIATHNTIRATKYKINRNKPNQEL